MKTKTEKTPLMMAESVAQSYWPVTIVPESKLSHMATAHYGFVPKLSHHGGKNTALRAEKPFSWSSLDSKRLQVVLFFSEAKRNGVFSSDDVFCCAATSDDVRFCARACSQAQSHDISTKAHRAKDISRGVFNVFVNNRNFIH